MKTLLINTYNETFEAPEDWILANTEAETTNEFLNTYTWDEGEWLYILYKMEKQDEEINDLKELLKQGYSLFKREDHEGILHASSKKTGYQFSYFDKYGAIGDIETTTLEEMAGKIYDYGFKPCHESQISIIK